MTKVRDLTPNRLNPRRISDKKRAGLKKSVEKFGDLGAIVFNVETNELVSGHQRISTLTGDEKIKITKKFDPPTAVGTTAIGTIEVGDELFAYREVKWDKKTQTEALLAANKHGGTWDADLLRVNFANVPDMDIAVTGFDLDELKIMDIEVAPVEIAKVKIGSILSDDEDDETDEQYLKKSAVHDAEVQRERLPDLINRHPTERPEPEPVKDIDPKDAFEKVDEKTTVENKRIVLIIDCDSLDMKNAIKDLIKKQVEEAGGRFF
jgi:hypothetical protein